VTSELVASLIDHTLLTPDAAQEDVEALCRDAVSFAFATVCINPTWVSLASRLLQPSDIGVCTVVGFPLGAAVGDVRNTRRAKRLPRRR